MTGAAAFLDVLRAHGVQYLFSSPGSEWPPVWEELARLKTQGISDFTYLNIRHEILAVSMASGYAKATGKLPVVLLHTTVGALHGAMALRAAYHEEIPMLVCVGESIAFGESPGFDPGVQWLRWLGDIGGPARLVEPVVKWSMGLSTRSLLASTVQRACQIAMTAPRGPVFISLPFELLVEEAADPPLSRCEFADPPHPSDRALEAAARTLVAGRAPLIIAETAGRDPDAVTTLVRLAERLGALVVEGLGQPYLSFPRNHPLHGGFDSRPHLGEADVVLLAGAVAPWHPPSQGPKPGVPVIALGEDPLRTRSPYWGYRTDQVVAGDLSASLSGILDHVARMLPAGDADRRARALRSESHNGERRRGWRAGAVALHDRRPIDPAWLFHQLNEVLPDEAIVVEETITHRLPLLGQLERVRPGGFYSAQSGGLGVGVGLALGVKCAMPGTMVVFVVGDGTFNYSPVLAALGFAQEYGLPILTVVCNNGGYVSMKRAFPSLYPDGWAVKTGTFFGAAIAPSPRYAALAEAFAAVGETVTEGAEVAPALQRAIGRVKAGESVVLDVVLGPVTA